MNRKMILVGVLLVGAGAIWLWTRSSEPRRGVLVGADFQEALAEYVAEVVVKSYPPRRRVTIVALVEDTSRPYQQRAQRLAELLEEAGHDVSTFNPYTSGVRIGDHYTPAMEEALSRLSPEVLVVSCAGSFGIMHLTPPLQRFFDQGGRAVFVGNPDTPDTPPIELVRRGQAIAVARRSGALAKHGRDKTSDRVGDHYMVLTAGNIASLIPPALP